MQSNRLYAFFVIFAAALSIYSSALSGQFIWDDEYQIRDNRYLTSWKYIPQILTTNITAGADSDCGFYRPLQILSYRLDYLVWKIEPIGYHLTAILLHALVAWVFFLLLESWGFGGVAALISALIFLTHPVQTEAVAYLSGRADLLAALFMLLAALWHDRKRSAAVVFFTLALLSKESALIFPALLWVSRIALKKNVCLKDILPYVLTAVVYLGLRLTVLVPFTLPSEAGTVLQRLPGVFASLVGYARVLLAPWLGLHMEYGLFFFKWHHPQVLLGLGIFSGLCFALWKYRKNSAAVLGLGWFLAAWLPISGLFPLHASMAEHWMYIPSLGLCIWAGSSLARPLMDGSKHLWAAIIGLGTFLIFSLLTYVQNSYWSDSAHFSTVTLKAAPNSWRANYMLGLHYGAMGEKGKAAGYYERAFTLNPRSAEAYYNLGNLLASVRDDETAAEYYLRAIEANPSYGPAYNNLANIYSRMGEHEKALTFYQKCVDLDPTNTITQKNLEAENSLMDQKS